jgi:glycosyltransferase involved in cell wall biosynthesis
LADPVRPEVPHEQMTYLIVIPAYNAAATIADVLGRLNGHGAHTVVVDDGSTDATPDIVRRLGAELVGHTSNRGVGAALKTGIRYARSYGYDQLVTLDADGQHDPGQVDEFLQALTDSDLVVGSRFLLEADDVYDAKVAANLLAALIVNDAFGVRLTDVACGYRAFRRPGDVLPRADGWGFLYEHLIGSLADGRQVATIPVPSVYRPSTLWTTRALEIEGFLAAMVIHAPDGRIAADVGRAHRAVGEREDFIYEVGGQVFHCFYVGVEDSYLVQTDLKSARAILSDFRRAPRRQLRQDGQEVAVRGSTPPAGPSVLG